MTAATDIITAASASIHPSPFLAVDDPANRSAANPKRATNRGLGHTARKSPYLTHLRCVEFRQGSLLAARGCAVKNLVGVIADAGIPSDVARIAAKPDAARMRDLCANKGRRAGCCFANNAVNKQAAAIDSRHAVTIPVGGVGPQHAIVRRRHYGVGNELCGDALKSAPSQRIAMLRPSEIMAAAEPSRDALPAALRNRAKAEVRHVYCW